MTYVLRSTYEREVERHLARATPASTVVEADLAEHPLPVQPRLLDADIIAVASHGRSGSKRALLGSVAEGVTRRSPRAVLIVRSEQSA
jgi:nucleotide-binding universal stress UspA family protein